MIYFICLNIWGKILSFFREVLIATKFGINKDLDLFFLLLSIVGIFTKILSQSLTIVLIPIIINIKNDSNLKTKDVNLFISNTINYLFIIITIIFIALNINSKHFIKYLYPDNIVFANNLFKIAIISIYSSLFIGIYSAYLSSNKVHIYKHLLSLIYNLPYILYLFIFNKSYGVKGLMYTEVIATIMQALLLKYGARKIGYKYYNYLNNRDVYINKLFYNILPVILSSAITDLNKVIDNRLAVNLYEGSISSLNYSNKLNNLIIGIFISVIATIIFPILSEESSKNNIDGVKKIMGKGINLVLIITVPATIGMIVLSKPIVQVAFERGAFDKIATQMTSRALIAYSLGLVAMSLRTIITRVYYSLQDTKTPMINGGFTVVINIILNLILVKYLDHVGLALATSIATTIGTVFLLYSLKKKIGSLGTFQYIRYFLKALVSSILMGIIVFFSYSFLERKLGYLFLGNFIALLSSATIGIIIYGILTYKLGIEEVRHIVKKGKSLLYERM